MCTLYYVLCIRVWHTQSPGTVCKNFNPQYKAPKLYNFCHRGFFKWQSSESQHRPFLLLSHNSFKAPSLFKTVILKAVQSVFKLLLLPAVTLHLNRVLSSFSFTRVTICAAIYAACCFVFVLAAGVLFPCTWFLTRYGKIPWFRSEKGIHNSAIGPTSILSI